MLFFFSLPPNFSGIKFFTAGKRLWMMICDTSLKYSGPGNGDSSVISFKPIIWSMWQCDKKNTFDRKLNSVNRSTDTFSLIPSKNPENVLICELGGELCVYTYSSDRNSNNDEIPERQTSSLCVLFLSLTTELMSTTLYTQHIAHSTQYMYTFGGMSVCVYIAM